MGVTYQSLFVDHIVLRWAPRYAPVFLPAVAMLLGVGLRELLGGRALKPGAIVLLVLVVALAGEALLLVRAFAS
ncbi:MAG: hypothetical protein AB7Y46_10945 [Armatimonadota bacterium]